MIMKFDCFELSFSVLCSLEALISVNHGLLKLKKEKCHYKDHFPFSTTSDF